jgi:CDGSH-type Zn-finger protein
MLEGLYYRLSGRIERSSMEITVTANGPLRVKGAPGEIVLKDPSGESYDLRGREVISLCRCGQSANKPFCDGSHNRVGFQHEPKAFALPEPRK